MNYVPPYPWMTESWVLKTRMCCKQSCYKDRFADGQETGEISSFPNVCIPEGATQALPWAAYSDTPSVSLGRFTVTPSSISLGRLTVTSLLCLSWGWLTVTTPPPSQLSRVTVTPPLSRWVAYSDTPPLSQLGRFTVTPLPCLIWGWLKVTPLLCLS